MNKWLIVGFLLISVVAQAQLETSADFRRTVYRNQMTGSFVGHTRGYGLNFRRGYFDDGYRLRGYEIDAFMLRHPKEIKYPAAPNFTNARSFVFGKMNSLYSLRFGYFREYTLVDKTDKGTVSVSMIASGGPTLGILKPVYLQIAKIVEGDIREVTERYDPEVHDLGYIFGASSFFKGFDDLSMRVGVYGKCGFIFDYNYSDSHITSLEVGGIIDYYPGWFGLYQESGPPVMAFTQNPSVWWQLYISFNFGKKWN